MQRVIVLGAGEIGSNLAARLSTEKRQVVVIDTNPEKLRAIENDIDVQTILGSASNPAVLAEAGVAEAGLVVAVTGNDEVNLLACLFANLRNQNSIKLARVQDEDYAAMSAAFGPEHCNVKAIINPDVEVVGALQRMLLLPTAVDYGEFGNGRVKIVAVEINSGPLVGKPLTEFQSVANDRNVRVSGILRGERLILPKGTDEVRQGDVVYFACLQETLATVLRISDASFKPIQSVCIVGGGDIALRLAAKLDGTSRRVKLVERRRTSSPACSRNPSARRTR